MRPARASAAAATPAGAVAPGPPALLGVDVGGTFTDAVVLNGGELFTAKVPTTPGDQAEGVLAAIRAALERAGIEPGAVGSFAHGMTVATNALLELRGARTALLTTRGFTDLLEIARQNRPSLYHLCRAKPAPLVDARLRIEVAERIGPEGVVEPLADEEVERVVAEVKRSAAESVAICLLFSYLEPEHERRLAAALRERLPEVHVSASSEVLAEFREYERCSTTVIDAYLSPLLGRYLGRLGEAAEAQGLPAPKVMMSSGGVASASRAARSGAWSVLSGPAGGAVGAGLIASCSSAGDALGFDMGGTSCDVCVVEAGRVGKTGSREIDGREIQLPMVDVHTVGAGGGSVAWRDSGGALRVGPHSAGAEPGPACYGRGGTEPTVTDANLLLGRLSPDSVLAGSTHLSLEAAERAVGRLAGALDLGTIEAAEGIVRVANAEMARALRVVTVERGVDPRRFALLPFGGAGPMHAAAIAEELGIGRILCPRAGGVLSALGLIASDQRTDLARTVMLRGAELTAERLREEVGSLRERAGGAPADRAEVTCELRYHGQAFELAIPARAELDPEALAEDFAAEHERRYGYRDPEGDVELVTLRLALIADGPRARPVAAAGALETGRRPARFAGETLDTAVHRGEPPRGFEAEGPCVFELPEATFVLSPGWSASVDETGTIVAKRRAAGRRAGGR